MVRWGGGGEGEGEGRKCSASVPWVIWAGPCLPLPFAVSDFHSRLHPQGQHLGGTEPQGRGGQPAEPLLPTHPVPRKRPHSVPATAPLGPPGCSGHLKGGTGHRPHLPLARMAVIVPEGLGWKAVPLHCHPEAQDQLPLPWGPGCLSVSRIWGCPCRQWSIRSGVKVGGDGNPF